MRIDLSLNGKLELKQALLLNQIAKELRKPYINFIAKISESHNTNLDWWADEPAGRNTLTDPLFYYISKVELLKKIIQAGQMFVITAGVPVGMVGTTNMLKVHKIT